MPSENTYSNGKGKYQKAYDILWDELVPKSGRADTEMGELLRRLARVYYRYYNDGDTYDDLCDDEFGNAMMVVENNSIGYTVIDKLIEYGYPNLYYSIKSTHEYIDQHMGEHQSNAIAGFSTTTKTRPLIVAKLEEFIRNKLIRTYSSRLANEFRTFIWNNGKPQAMRGYNDDLVMALAICCWVRDTALQTNARDLNYQKAFVDAIMTSRTTLNTQINGQIGYTGEDQTSKMNEARNLYSQYMWIIK